VYLRVLSMRDVKRSEIKGKLTSHYIGPFPILVKLGECDIPISAALTDLYNMFPVSQFKKFLKPPADIVTDDTAPLNIEILSEHQPAFYAYRNAVAVSFLSSNQTK
jgi:hypothetical protein